MSRQKLYDIAKAVCNAVILDPLTAGSTRDPTGSQSHNSDGQIAATVTTTCITSICFVLVAIFLGERSENETAYTILLGIIIGIGVIAIFAILWISVVAHLNAESWYRNDQTEHKDGLRISTTFLWVFGMASVAEEALEMAINIGCLDFNHKMDTTGYRYRWFSLCSNIITILFYCIQISFVTYFIRFSFEKYISINYGLLFTLMTNAVLWFISEMEDLVGYYEDLDIHANRSQDPCFWNSNITREVLIKLQPYLSPANIEFFLLSSGLILSMMPKHSQSDLEEEEEQTPEELVPILSPSERRHAVERSYRRHHPITHFAFIIIVIIVNLTLITGNVVFVFVLPDNNSMFCTWLVIDTFYKLIVLIVILLIYYHIHIFGEKEPRRHHLKPGQYILLISTMGTVAVCVFGLIGGVQILPAFKGHIYMADNSFDIIVAFLQTVLLIHMERINRFNSEGNHIPTELLCIFLAICNMTSWILDSFVDVRYIEAKHITGEIFDKENWDDVQDLLAPMLIFYRFHAFLDWYCIYCKFRRMHT